jgi:hypothetical protein
MRRPDTNPELSYLSAAISKVACRVRSRTRGCRYPRAPASRPTLAVRLCSSPSALLHPRPDPRSFFPKPTTIFAAIDIAGAPYSNRETSPSNGRGSGSPVMRPKRYGHLAHARGIYQNDQRQRRSGSSRPNRCKQRVWYPPMTVR